MSLPSSITNFSFLQDSPNFPKRTESPIFNTQDPQTSFHIVEKLENLNEDKIEEALLKEASDDDDDNFNSSRTKLEKNGILKQKLSIVPIMNSNISVNNDSWQENLIPPAPAPPPDSVPKKVKLKKKKTLCRL